MEWIPGRHISFGAKHSELLLELFCLSMKFGLMAFEKGVNPCLSLVWWLKPILIHCVLKTVQYMCCLHKRHYSDWLTYLATCLVGGKRSSSTFNIHSTRCHYIEAFAHTLQTSEASMDVYQAVFENETIIVNCNISNAFKSFIQHFTSIGLACDVWLHRSCTL